MRTLAVVVLNWNGADDTLALLDTLARCRVPAGWAARVMVVDNGSTDGSVARIAAAHPEAEVVALGENRLFAGGNNEGVRRALDRGADAVMLLNNDTEADPGLYEHLLRALDQDPDADGAGPMIYYGAPTDRIWYAGGVCRLALGLLLHRGLRRRDDGRYRSVEPTGYLTGCCLLARREAWERVGLLDERYHLYAEDADWCLRARAAGRRLLFVPAARLWHKVSASAGRNSRWKIYQRVRANLTLLARHTRGPARFTWLPSFLLVQCAVAGWLVANGNAGAAAGIPLALWDALRRRPASEFAR